jgi:hypothetical protein
VLRRRRSATAETHEPGGDGSPGSTGSANGSADETKGMGRPGAVTAGKGRPTPKRSEAERRNRPYSAPADRKEAARASRDRQRQKRVQRMEAMRRGEEWALAAKDRGPAKALVRDYVDSRRWLSELNMYWLLFLLVVTFVGSRIPIMQVVTLGLFVLTIFVVGTEWIYVGRRAAALVAERLPGESTRGVGSYSARRAMTARRLRIPQPRIKRGESF